MGSKSSPPANRVVTAARKLYRPLGFSKGYNFALFSIFAGALLGFSLARIQFFDFNGKMCGGGPGGTLPGECFWYRKSLSSQVGIRMHLLGVLPAGILVCFQFVPIVRRKWILFHRVNGYMILLLVLAGIVGALMIARHAVGGGLDVQTGTGFLALIVSIELGLAWWNIKKLQIDQHRVWMLRAWFLIISRQGSYFQPRLCEHVEFMLESAEQALGYYPDCAPYFNGSNPAHQTLIRASMTSGRIDEIAVALGAPFGMALWLGMAIQATGVEIYLQLTPRESARLRQVSYHRQLEAGYTPPGSAGLVPDRLGDAEPWAPAIYTGIKTGTAKPSVNEPIEVNWESHVE